MLCHATCPVLLSTVSSQQILFAFHKLETNKQTTTKNLVKRLKATTKSFILSTEDKIKDLINTIKWIIL